MRRFATARSWALGRRQCNRHEQMAPVAAAAGLADDAAVREVGAPA
jgi:hypothetical protein